MKRLPWLLGAPLVAWWGTWLATAVAGAGALRRARAARPPATSGHVDVIVPAHDEERNLPVLLGSLGLPDGAPGLGRVLVIADHCSDGTADVARGLGARVLRRETGPRGKPAALRDGLAWYAGQEGRGDGLLFVDADCRCSPGLPAHVVEALRRAPVVQTANLVGDGGGDSAAGGVALGMYLRNLLRPAGLARMGAPVMLSGTGMAVRGDHLDLMRFGDEQAEDLALSRRLLARGVHVGFVPAARVSSDAPPDSAGLTSQRERWEGGSLRAMAGVPGVAVRLAARGDWRGLIALTDSSAPPLALAAAGGAGLAGASGLAVLFGARRSVAAPAVLAAGLLAAYLGVGATAAHGRSGVLRLAAQVPGFLAWKLGVYRRMAGGRASAGWERTPREARSTTDGG
ncbi:MAG: glycosyltransferase [Thermoleophilia bacterium]|nr:glycosyltransferase [Thermoleophilia bacterium]